MLKVGCSGVDGLGMTVYRQRRVIIINVDYYQHPSNQLIISNGPALYILSCADMISQT